PQGVPRLGNRIYVLFEVIFAVKYSRFIRAITLTLIAFGHSASQAPVLEQAPNPSASICSTIFSTRAFLSGLPCGNKANCEIFAPTNRAADEFLHAATQAPQPMQAAASKASAATRFGIGISLASGTPPVLMEMNPPACWMRSKAERSTMRSLMTGKDSARQGSTTMVSPSAKLLM